MRTTFFLINGYGKNSTGIRLTSGVCLTLFAGFHNSDFRKISFSICSVGIDRLTTMPILILATIRP